MARAYTRSRPGSTIGPRIDDAVLRGGPPAHYGGGLIVPLVAGVRRNRIELVVGITVRVVDVRLGEVATTVTSQGMSDRRAVKVGALGLSPRGGWSGSRTSPPSRKTPSSARPFSGRSPLRRRESSMPALSSGNRNRVQGSGLSRVSPAQVTGMVSNIAPGWRTLPWNSWQPRRNRRSRSRLDDGRHRLREAGLAADLIQGCRHQHLQR